MHAWAGPQQSNMMCTLQEMDFIELLAPCQYLIKQGFVPNMRVPGTFYVNEHLRSLIFEELQAAVDKGGVGGFLPAVKQLANVAALPGIVKACPRLPHHEHNPPSLSSQDSNGEPKGPCLDIAWTLCKKILPCVIILPLWSICNFCDHSIDLCWGRSDRRGTYNVLQGHLNEGSNHNKDQGIQIDVQISGRLSDACWLHASTNSTVVMLMTDPLRYCCC